MYWHGEVDVLIVIRSALWEPSSLSLPVSHGDKCKNCSLCSKNCKAACIDFKTHTVDYSRCVVCGNCIDSCKFGALKYSCQTSRTSGPSSSSPVDTSKRSFLLASALVTTAAMAQKKEKLMDGGLADIEDKVAPKRQSPLTPPGFFRSFIMLSIVRVVSSVYRNVPIKCFVRLQI